MFLKDIHVVRESARNKSFAVKMFALYLTIATVIAVEIYLYIPILELQFAVLVPAFIAALSLYRAIWWIFNWNLSRVNTGTSGYFAPVVIIFGVSIAVYSAFNLYIYYCGQIYTRYIVTFLMFSSGVVFVASVMHARSVMIIVASLTLVPAVLLMLSFGTTEMTAVAALAVALVVLLLVATYSYHVALARLERSLRHIEQLGLENTRLASLDMLTGLPNRRHFFSALETALQARSTNRIAVGLVDLDGFKPVNDTFGHRVGDAVLAEAARRLSSASASIAEFCRIGGDEFAFLVVLTPDGADLAKLGEALVASLVRPIDVGALRTAVGCSVGFAVCPDTADTADELFEQADFALYQAKREGGGRIVVFGAEHRDFLVAQGAIEFALRTADFDAEFYPLFQPFVDLDTGKVLAFECLARWDSPMHGPVSPCRFIPVAEQAGLVSRITEVMLRKALAEAAAWPEKVGLSFNLSAHDLTSPALALKVLAIIETSGIAARRITLEITETALLHDFRSATQTIAMFKKAGIRVALDDFGTGWSSLSHVHALPLDELKVDRQFVSDILTNEASRNIVRSVLSLCQDMGLESVVEGVETKEQLTILRGMGCRVVQGFYYSRPLDARAAAAYARAPLAAAVGQ